MDCSIIRIRLSLSSIFLGWGLAKKNLRIHDRLLEMESKLSGVELMQFKWSRLLHFWQKMDGSSRCTGSKHNPQLRVRENHCKIYCSNCSLIVTSTQPKRTRWVVVARRWRLRTVLYQRRNVINNEKQHKSLIIINRNYGTNPGSYVYEILRFLMRLVLISNYP